MNQRLLDAARDLRKQAIKHPGKEFLSTEMAKKHNIARVTALLLLKLLTYSGMLTETRERRARVFTSTGPSELPPLATLIGSIQEADNKNERAALNPPALAAIYGCTEEAARAALAAAGVNPARKASSPPPKPEAPTGDLPLLEQPIGFCPHPLGWLCSSPGKRDLVISQGRFGPFALPADPLNEWGTWRLGAWTADEIGEWTWEVLRTLSRAARRQEPETHSRGLIMLPDRGLIMLPDQPPGRPQMDVWITGQRPPDRSNKKRPHAVQWMLVWHSMLDSTTTAGRGGELLLDVDPKADTNKILLVVFHADGQPLKLIRIDELLSPDACVTAAWAAHRGRLATVVQLVERAYKRVGWPATHRL